MPNPAPTCQKLEVRCLTRRTDNSSNEALTQAELVELRQNLSRLSLVNGWLALPTVFLHADGVGKLVQNEALAVRVVSPQNSAMHRREPLFRRVARRS
jgi:hypothetical protein